MGMREREKNESVVAIFQEGFFSTEKAILLDM